MKKLYIFCIVDPDPAQAEDEAIEDNDVISTLLNKLSATMQKHPY